MKNREDISVIVIGDHVQALGIIRSLGRRGIPVYLLHDKHLCISRFSRYTKQFIKMPDLSNESEFVEFMIELSTKNKQVRGGILMPTNDAIVKIISKNKEVLEEYYRVPTPSWDVVKFALNKRLTYLIAKKTKIPIPKTICPDSISDIEKLYMNVQYPVILKGVYSFDFYKKAGVKAYKANSFNELKKILNDISSLVNPSEIIIQEEIPGNTNLVYSFCSFFKNGEAIGVWTGRKLREHPIGLGTGTFAESIYVPEIIELGSKLLKVIDYYGISEIEFKKDPRDGDFKLIEINPRTWLWIGLATRAGVDLPYMLYRDMIGEDVIPIKHFRENIKWIHIYTDIGVVVKEVLRGKLGIKDYIYSLRCEKELAVFSFDDPIPFIAEALMLLYLWKTR